MADQFLCTRCSTPLDAPSASGLCVACALATQAEQPPAAGPPAPDTPQAREDGTPAGENPNPFAPTHTGPDAAPTASGPPAPRGDLPDAPEGFTLYHRLGGGGMGDVYLAHEAATNRFVAVKFLRRAGNAQLLDRFKLEFRALANLNHPNAVDVYTYKFDGPAPFYAMEFLEGGSVADRLRASGPLAAADAVELIRKVAGAVRALHEHRAHGCLNGVIHRDIKPGNILLTDAGEPKLADFGLVKYLDADTLTHTLQEVGTAQYMPPEQFNRANGEVGYPADVYGLGATLYHLLTGCPPFTGETVFDVRDAVLGAAPVRVRALRPEVPLELEAVVLKCLAKDPAERYQTVAELLKALANPELDPAPRYTRGYRARQGLKRHSRALSLGAVALTAVALVAWYWPKGGEDPASTLVAGLEAGKKQELIGRNGPTVPVRWAVRQPERAGPKLDGKTPAPFAALCPETSLGLLLNDPKVESYRLRGRFRQDVQFSDVGDNGKSRTGLVVGYTELKFDAGRTLHFATAVAFQDHQLPPKTKPDRYHLIHDDWGLVDFPLKPLGRVPQRGFFLKLDPPTGDERDWHEFTVDVRPSGITFELNGNRQVASREFIQENWERIAKYVAKTEPGLPQFAAPKWSPRLPIGLAVQHSWSSFADLTIEPLPAP